MQRHRRGRDTHLECVINLYGIQCPSMTQSLRLQSLLKSRQLVLQIHKLALGVFLFLQRGPKKMNTGSLWADGRKRTSSAFIRTVLTSP